MLEQIQRFLDSDDLQLQVGTGHQTSHPQFIFPGSFNPLHRGHRRMADYASRRFDQRVDYEISVTNVDKSPLGADALLLRLRQFDIEKQRVWLTKAPTFVEKSNLFAGTTFLLGADTVKRLIDRQYYRDEQNFTRSLEQFRAQQCRFLAFGRLIDGEFEQLFRLPEALQEVFEFVPEADFRCDISSSEVREQTKPS